MTVLVNNAGLSRRLRSIRRLEPDEQRPIIDVNLVGTLEVCRHVLPHMRRAGRGRIVNMSSMGSLAGKEGLRFLAVYSAASAGVIAFTKELRGQH